MPTGHQTESKVYTTMLAYNPNTSDIARHSMSTYQQVSTREWQELQEQSAIDGKVTAHT